MMNYDSCMYVCKSIDTEFYSENIMQEKYLKYIISTKTRRL